MSGWIKMSDADGIYWACSECGKNIPRISCFDRQFDVFPRLKSLDRTDYCSHCGAKMENGPTQSNDSKALDALVGVHISVEEAEEIIAFTKMHEREEIPEDMWDIIMRLQEELE